ncbi:MAG: site-2 protease family protein, partial [Planctomycetota bacterium]
MPTIQYWIAAENLWLVAIIIGGTKILHELGHGIACRHFGGRCRSIGFMLMVLVPALYCDTSDAWLIPQRYKRVLIGAAGMLVETLLAAIAVFIWASTNDDATRITALQVIVVCGVGTIILNANPLLRYDGYYILSDLWGVSNLSQTASATLKSEWMHRVWQQPLDVSISGVSTPQRLLLCVYAISAFLYRFLLLFTILWFVTQMLRPYGMQSAGILAVAMAGTTMIGTAIWRSAKKRSQSPRLLMRIAESAAPLIGHVSQRGKPVGMFRRLSVWLIAIGLVGLAFVPMPRRVQCDGKLIPEKETLMYAKTDGWMPQEPPTASLYKPITDDEVLMTLRNPDVVAEVAMASANL